MIYARLLSVVLTALAILYYTLVILQCFGIVRFTKKAIKFPNVLIPFYYFFNISFEKSPTFRWWDESKIFFINIQLFYP